MSEIHVISPVAGSSYLPDPRPSVDTVGSLQRGPARITMHPEVAQAQLFPSKDPERDPRRLDREFRYLDYTAVLQIPDPEVEDGSDDDFPKRLEIENFPLLHNLKAASRLIKVALVITMYNENLLLFLKSLKAVQKNIDYLCQA
ncbi:hypothetical protein HDU91_003167, partial [Kappamyces sp. JEL0680]